MEFLGQRWFNLIDKRIKVGIIGIGFGQQVLVPAFRANERCEVVALCASNLERSQNVAIALQIAKAYGNWQELVWDPDIEAIAIATPPTLQPAIAIAVLTQGKHVFCEKPLASTLEAAKMMLKTAHQSGKAHMIDFEFPEIAVWQQAKDILNDGSLGNIHHVVVSWQVETYANRMKLQSWKTTPNMGGGTLNSFVSHVFCYLEWLLGPIRYLSTQLFSPAGNIGDTFVILCLENAAAVPISVSVNSNAFLGTGHRIEIYGSDGTIILDNPTTDYVNGFKLWYGTRKTAQLKSIEVELTESSQKDGRVVAVGHLVRRFVNWIDDGIISNPNFEDGYRVQFLLDAANSAHETKQRIDCYDLNEFTPT